MKLLEMNNIERYYKTPAGVVKALMELAWKFMKVKESFFSARLAQEKQHSSTACLHSIVQPKGVTCSKRMKFHESILKK